MIRAALAQRLQIALSQDRSVVRSPSTMEEGFTGFPLEKFEELGLSESDMKKLELAGFAVRGYVATNRGNRTRWFILAPDKEKTDVSTS